MRRKFEVLDALRGFCALIVVLLHFSENYAVNGLSPILPHGCLPVEYFFILTGFALTYAYDGRWDRMTLGGFFRRRLVRMQPLVVIGSVIGAMCYLIAPGVYSGQVPGGGLNVGQVLLLTLWCCTMLPAPRSLGWVLLHPLQGPLWTMLYIYFANVLYALVLRHLKTWILGVLAVGAIGFTLWIGVMNGGFHGGPSWKWTRWANVGALARMAFPVLAGMVIARKGWRIPTGRAGLWVCVAVLAGIFFAPNFLPDRTLNGLFESAAVVIGMPLVLLCGVGGTIGNARLASVCRFLGAYSFPLYATHYSMTMLNRAWIAANPDAPFAMHMAVACSFAAFALMNGYVAMRLSEGLSSWFSKKEEGK